MEEKFNKNVIERTLEYLMVLSEQPKEFNCNLNMLATQIGVTKSYGSVFLRLGLLEKIGISKYIRKFQYSDVSVNLAKKVILKNREYHRVKAATRKANSKKANDFDFTVKTYRHDAFDLKNISTKQLELIINLLGDCEKYGISNKTQFILDQIKK